MISSRRTQIILKGTKIVFKREQRQVEKKMSKININFFLKTEKIRQQKLFTHITMDIFQIGWKIITLASFLASTDFQEG